MKKKWETKWIRSSENNTQGGQGNIYCVYHIDDPSKTIYILKELINVKRIERFSDEIEAINNLQGHSNIISIIDKSLFSEKRDRPYYVMEKADDTLPTYLTLINYEIFESLDAFSQILAGVSYIHKNKIIHRDLKPDNILIINNVIKIADFGICLFEDQTRHTTTLEAVGSRYYMAPELENGKLLNVDYSVDIYSLSKILYYILSRGKIFSRENYKAHDNNLTTLFNDKRFDLVNDFFSYSITENLRLRIKTIEEYITKFEKLKENFKNHSITKFYKFKAYSDNLILTKQYLLENEFDENELNIFLSFVYEKNNSLSLDFLQYLSTKLTEVLLNNYIKLFEKIFDTLLPEIKSEICINIIKNKSVLKKINFGLNSFFLQIIKIVLKFDDLEILENIASKSFMTLRHDIELSNYIINNFNKLSNAGKLSSIIELIYINFKDKYQFFYSLLSDKNTTEIFHYIIVGIFSSMDDSKIPIVYNLANSEYNDDFRRAFIQGMVLGLSWNKILTIKIDTKKLNDPVMAVSIETLYEANQNGA